MQIGKARPLGPTSNLIRIQIDQHVLSVLDDLNSVGRTQLSQTSNLIMNLIRSA